MQHHIRRTSGAPKDVHLIVIGCERADQWNTGGQRVVDMQVRKSGRRRMFELLGVNVFEGRLKESPQEGYQT